MENGTVYLLSASSTLINHSGGIKDLNLQSKNVELFNVNNQLSIGESSNEQILKKQVKPAKTLDDSHQ